MVLGTNGAVTWDLWWSLTALEQAALSEVMDERERQQRRRNN